MMNWIYLAFVLAAAALAAYRIWHAIRRVLAERADDWDERLVKNLRAQGGDPFSPYEIDFFFGVPEEPQCQPLADVLSAEGFAVDFRAMSTEGATGYTLHARKAIRVSIPEMKAYSARLRALADQHQVSYDGWATAGVTKTVERAPRLYSLRGNRPGSKRS
jgi:hypothetical protein